MFNFNRSASTGSAAPAAGTGFSFGNAASPTTAPPSGGFSFGGAAAAAPAASSGFSFGGAGAAAPAASSGFSFGGAGAAAPAASSGFSFGGASSTAQQQPAGSGFGMTGFSSSFGAQPAAQQQQQPQQASMDSQPGLTRIMELQLAYAPYIDGSGNPLSALPEPVAGQTPPVVLINKNCEFEFVFYDLIQLNSTTGAPMRRPKPSYISQRQWDRINEMENPNPDKLEPTIVHGIRELKARFELQSKNTTKLADYLEEIKKATGVLESSLSQVVTRIAELKRSHEKLTVKLLDVIGKIEVLRCRTVPLRASEVKYREKLENVLVALTHKHSQLVELMNAEKHVPRSLQAQSRAKSNIVFENAQATTAEELCVIYQSLKQQREGLQQLTDTLRKDARDIGIIERSRSTM